MNKEDFIDISKRMVVEYYNRYVYHVIELTIDKVRLVEYSDKSDKKRVLLSAGVWLAKKYYEVIYDETTKKFYSKAFDKKVIS